jgi:prevent-host-death family protein
MKFVGVREAAASLSGLVEKAQKERVVLTRHGKPVALLTGLEGKDLDQILLDNDPELQVTLKQRMAAAGPFVPLEDAEAMVAKKAKRRAPVTPPKRAGSRRGSRS